jgi:hypothetical protein
MVTSTQIRHLLRDLHFLIIPEQYEDLVFAISNFELYLSGDEYAEGDEFRELIRQFEEVLEGLYEEAQVAPELDEESVSQLHYAIEDYLGELGYDWDFPHKTWLKRNRSRRNKR